MRVLTASAQEELEPVRYLTFTWLVTSILLMPKLKTLGHLVFIE
jgi:hypothetical protein